MSADSLSIREHLNELKNRVKVVFLSYAGLLAIFLLAPANPYSFLSLTGTYVPFVSFFLSRVRLDLLPPGWELIPGGITSPLEVYLIASAILAAVFNAPIFAYEVMKFVTPALTENEKGFLYPFVASSTGLFVVGVLFGYFFLAKFLFIAIAPFFVTAQVTQPLINVADFFSIVFLTIGMSGLAFTSPVYVFALIRFRIISPSTFRRNRVIIWFVVYVATAIVTPDGGPILDLILFIPIIALLEVAVWLGGRSMRTSGPPPGACRYCGAALHGQTFCPSCGRSEA